MEIKDFKNIYGYKYYSNQIEHELKITLFLCNEKPFKRHNYTDTPVRNTGNPIETFVKEDGTEAACILNRTDINTMDRYSLRYWRAYYTFKGYALPTTADEIHSFVTNIISYQLLPESEDTNAVGNVHFINEDGEPFETVVEKRKNAVSTLELLNK